MDSIEKLAPNFSNLKRLSADFISNLIGRFRSYFASLDSNPRIRFLTFLWSVAVIFIGFHILVQANPLRFIVPGFTYPFPVFDQREKKEIFYFSADKRILRKTIKKIYHSDQLEQNVQNLAFTISGLHELRDGEHIINDAEIFPTVAFGIKKIWFYNEKNAGQLIIDLREDTIDEEFNLFFKDRQFADYKTKSYFLDAYFEVLTRSIFSIENEVKLVIYLVDGESKTLPDMKFDLSIPHKLQ